jgi:hypothetical protein
MTIVPYTQPETPRDWIALMPPAVELAKAVANTDFVPAGLRGNPAAITAAILYGDEVGLGPMQALAHISVIDGRPSMSSEAMRALVLARGHDVWVEEATATRVTVGGRRKDSDQVTRVTWTMDDAKRANLAGKRNWRTYPRQMLIARATAELARAIFADAIGGLVASEELEDLPESDGQTAPSDLAQSGTRRRRRAPLAPVSASEPAPSAVSAGPPLPGEETSAATEPVSTRAAGGPGEEESGPTDISADAGLREQAPAPSSSPAADTIAADEHGPLRKRLMATYREQGFTERAQRLAFARVVIARPIESSNDLTPGEASRIIDALEAHGEA